MRLVEPLLPLLSNPAVLKIGIQVRVGDHAFQMAADPDALVNTYQAYFKCAQQLEQSYMQPQQQVVWLLVSDSPVLRTGAARRFGSKLLTASGLKLEHSSHGNAAKTSLEGFLASIAENWVFGLTDFQVVSEESAYGKTAAMRSLQPGSAYLISSRVSPDCRPGSASNLWQAAEVFTGW
jgi:hypothetical protein